VQLDETTQKQLREAVFRADGLAMAGSHDDRNEKLNDALGIKRIGSIAGASSAVLDSGLLNVTGTLPMLPGDRIDRIKRTTAQTFATYAVSGSSRSGENDCRNEDQDEDTRDECDGQPNRYLDAITLNRYGSGKALFAGFDLLAEATQEGAGSLAAQALLAGLTVTQPPVQAQLGGVVPVKLTLKNQGIATSATAIVMVPNATTIVDAGGGTVIAGTQGQAILWTVNLALAEQKDLTFYLRLPVATGAITIDATVRAGANVVAPATLAVDSPGIASLNDLYNQAQALASQTSHQPALIKAADHLGKAIDEHRLDQTLLEALAATDALLGITDADVQALRSGIDRWLRYASMLLE